MKETLIKNRIEFGNLVKSSLLPYSNLLRCYGSFSNNSFHISPCGKHSFSDIDLFTLENLSSEIKNELKLSLQDFLFRSTGIIFRISIRDNKIHNFTINKIQSELIAKTEYLTKISGTPSVDYTNYQASKLILRVSGGSNYFLNPLSINGYYKNGLKREFARELIANKIGRSRTTNPLLNKTFISDKNPIFRFILNSHNSDLSEIAINVFIQSLVYFDVNSDLFKDISDKFEKSKLLEINEVSTYKFKN